MKRSAALAVSLAALVATAGPAMSATKTTKKAVKTTKAAKTTKTTKATVKSEPTVAPTTAAPSTSAAPSNVQRGGTLVATHIVDVNGLDPTFLAVGLNSNGELTRFFPIFDMLVYEDADGTIKPRLGDLTSTDAINWTLKIKPNVKFSDGTPYDAAAVKFNWDRIADPTNRAAGASTALQIAKSEVVDATTLKITLKEANGQFPRAVSKFLAFIGSPTAIKAKGDGFATAPVGAGPFIVKDWVRTNQITMTRNPTYWDAPRPYVDTLIIRTIPDNDQRYNTFTSDSSNQIMYLTGLPQADKAIKAGYKDFRYVPNGGRQIAFNPSKPPFNDVRARRAMTLALDADSYVKTLDGPLGIVPRTFFQPGTPFYTANADIPARQFDVAQRLLDDLAKDNGGKPLEFTITVGVASRAQAEVFQAQLELFRNVKVKIEAITGSLIGQRSQAKDYEAIIGASTFSDPEPAFYSNWHSKSPANTGFSSPEMDAALELGRTSLDPAVRKQAYDKAQQILIDNSIWFIYARFIQYDFIKPEVQDFSYFSDGSPWFDRIWLKK